MPLVLTPDEVSSFGGRHRIAVVEGPFSLFRLVGRTATGRANDKYGRFWFHDRLFWSVLDEITQHAEDPALVNFLIRRLLRELTAVCFDWNSFAAIYRLDLPKGRSLEVAVGRIRSQPFYSGSGPWRGRDPLGRELLGGEFQYVIDVSRDVQPWVTGPIPLRIPLARA